MSGNGATIVINAFGTKFGLVNTAMGTYDSNGKLNISGLMVGGASAVLGVAEMFGKSSAIAQISIGMIGADLAIEKMKQSYFVNGTIKSSDVFSLAGNVGNVAIGFTKAASPWGGCLHHRHCFG
ncbi:MAG: hypothetical protein WBJ21_12960 [Burkholderiaceae bacterium]